MNVILERLSAQNCDVSRERDMKVSAWDNQGELPKGCHLELNPVARPCPGRGNC